MVYFIKNGKLKVVKEMKLKNSQNQNFGSSLGFDQDNNETKYIDLDELD